MSADGPKVTVGIPVYNQAEVVRVAVASALDQDYVDIEIVVVDDASDDGTREVCEGLAAGESRVRYDRNDTRLGAIEAHRQALAAAKGDYFMWLGAGDRLQPDYVLHCAAYLDERPDYILAAGRRRPAGDGGDSPALGGGFSLTLGDPVRRVEAFLEASIDPGLWHGLFRRSQISADGITKALGFDFAFLVEAAFQGKMATVEKALCIGSTVDEPVSPDDMAEELQLPQFQARDPYLVIAAQVFCNIAFRSPVFGTLPRVERLNLAANALTKIARRWPIEDEGEFIAVATQIFPNERIPEQLHDIRLFVMDTLFSDEADEIFEPLSRAEEIINTLCRIRIGSLPPSDIERNRIQQIRQTWESTDSTSYHNKAVMALALFV
jgi:hypothetical protein